MKKLIILFIILSHISSASKETDPQCRHTFEYGGRKYCLPIIDDMIECYNRSAVKSKADETESDNSRALAVYLTNTTFSEVETIDGITHNDDFQINGDFIKISAPISSENINVNKSQLDGMSEMIDNSYIRKDWKNLLQEMKNKNLGVSIGQPIIIKSYSIAENVKTFIMMTKYYSTDYQYHNLTAMNITIVKNKFLFVNYVANYTDENSLEKLISKNDSFIRRFLDENNE